MRRTSNIVLVSLIIIFLIYISVFAYMLIDERNKVRQAKYKFDMEVSRVINELVPINPVHADERRFFGNPICEYDDKGNCPLDPYVEGYREVRPVISVPVSPSSWLFLFGGFILLRKK